MFLDQKMARTSNSILIALLAMFSLAAVLPQQASATRVSKPLAEAIQARFPQSLIRLDASIETKLGELFVPVIVPGMNPKNGAVTLVESFPEPKTPDVLLFSDGWCFLRVYKKGSINTVISAESLPVPLRKILLSGKMPDDLIVPEQFSMPRSLKVVTGDLKIPLIDDAVAALPKIEESKSSPKSGGHGAVIVTSPKNGNVLMLDEHALTKIGEYPTEGIPTGLACGNGKVYITDQAKSCVLIFDLKRKTVCRHHPIDGKKFSKRAGHLA